MVVKIFSAFVYRIVGALLAYLSSILISRSLGIEETGLYFLAISVLALLTVLCTLGFNNAIVKCCSDSGCGNTQKANIFFTALIYSGAFSIAIAIIAIVASQYSPTNDFIDSNIRALLLFIAPAIFFNTALSLISSLYQSQHKISHSIFVLNIATNFLMILFVSISSLYLKLNAQFTLNLFIFALFVNFGLSLYSTKNLVKFGEMLNLTSIPGWTDFWVTTIAVALLSYGIMIVASFNLELADIGLLGAAQRAALLVAFILAAVNLVTTPKYSEIYSSGNFDQLRTFAQKTTLLMTLVALPVLLFVFFSSKLIMGFFGKDFVQGYEILWIICASQFFNVAFGSVSSLLNMTGNASDCRNVNMILVVPLLVLSYYSSKWYGVYGIAYTICTIQFAQNFVLYLYVFKRLGFSTINFNLRQFSS